MVKIGRPRTTKGLAVMCAKLAEDKIASDILIMDLSKIDIASTDYFVVCTCDSDVQVKSLVTAIERKCKEFKLTRPKVEGLDNSQWVLMDFFDVVVHIMLPETREYYKLEKLWNDALFYELNDSGKPKAVKLA